MNTSTMPDHAAKMLSVPTILHAANQRRPAQIIQLANDFRVRVLQILMVQRANDAGQAQKAVGVGQQQQEMAGTAGPGC